MKKLIFLIMLLFPILLFSQTKNIVPRADGEGSIGTLLKAWGDAYFDSLFINGTSFVTLMNAKQNAMGGDDNYVTDAEKVKLTNLSGTNTGDNATNTQYSGLAASKFNTSAAQILIDSVYRSNDTVYFHQVDGSRLFFVDTGGTTEGDTSSYTLSQIDSLLALAGTAIQSSNMNSLAEFDTQIGLTGTPSSSTYLRGDGSWATVTAGAAALDDLTDVVITAPSNSQALTYNGSNWVNTTLSGSVTAGQITQLNMMWTYLALDTTGIAGTFLEATDTPVSTLTASNVIDVSANDVIRIATDSASYRVYSNGGWTSWTSTAGYYKDVDSAQVRHVSSASNSATTDQTLWVSNDSETFTINTVAGGGGGEQMETTRFLDALSTGLASGTETAIDSFVVMLKDTFALDSLSQMFNAIYLHAIETEEASLKNLVKRSHDATEVNSDLIWTANEGWKGDYDGGNVVGTGYLDCNYNFATDTNSIAGRLSLGVTIYVRNSDSTDGPWNNQPIYSVNEGAVGTVSLNMRRDDNTGIIRLNDETWSATFSNTSPYVGVYTLNRNSNTRTVYKNSASLFSETQATTGIPNLELWLLRSNTDGVVAGRSTPKQISIVMVHRGLTSLTEHQTLRNICEWWMDRWGKGVL